MNATSETIGKISAALAKAQGAMNPALIDGKATVEMKSGGKYGYTYASLTSVWEAIRKPLSDNGLAVIQRTDDEGGVIFLYTILAHESGEFITSRLYVGSVGRSAQETGSALTYARRYGLSAIVGVVTDEDDDGAEATKSQKAAPKPAQQPKQSAGPVWNSPAEASDAEFSALPSASAERAATNGKSAPPAKAELATNKPWQTWGGRSDAVAWAETVGFNKFHADKLWTKVQAEGRINSKDMPEPFYNACLERIAAGKTDNPPSNADLDKQAADEEDHRNETAKGLLGMY